MNETYRRVFGVRRTTPEVVSCIWREEFDYDGAGNRIQKRNGWEPSTTPTAERTA